jgi:hypothetical protein
MVWWIIIIVAGLFVSFFGMIVNVLGKHGRKHPEAQKIRDAFHKKGHIQLWQEKEDKFTFHYIVDLGDGTYGDWVVHQDKGTNIEKTAFIPKDGKLSSVENWLKQKAKKMS